MKSKIVPSDAEMSARQRQDVKRKGCPSISQIRLSNKESVYVERIFKLHGGTKKQAVLDGLSLLLNKLKKS